MPWHYFILGQIQVRQVWENYVSKELAIKRKTLLTVVGGSGLKTKKNLDLDLKEFYFNVQSTINLKLVIK